MMRTGLTTAGPPGTARRLGTASMGVSSGVGIGLNTNVEVHDTYISREGMVSTANLAAKQGNRAVRDRSYFAQLLRQLTKDLQDEIIRLKDEQVRIQNDSMQTEQYAQKLKNLNDEVAKLQTTNRELNMALQVLTTSGQTDDSDVIDDVLSQKAAIEERNAQLSQDNNVIFGNRKEKDEQIRDIMQKIQQYQNMLENRLSQNPEQRKIFYSLKDERIRLLQEQDVKQQELQKLESMLVDASREFSSDPVQQRYLQKLEEKMDIEVRRSALERELNRLTGEESDFSASIVSQVKNDKELIKNMTDQINDMRAQCEKLTKEIKDSKENMKKFTGEGAKRFQELQERDRLLQEYIDNFDKTKAEDQKNLKDHQDLVVKVLEHISQAIKDQEQLPSVEKFNELRENLAYKQEQKGYAETTLQQLERELDLRSKELESMESLPEKLEQSLHQMRMKIEQMKSELHEYNDIDGLKVRSGDTKKDLERKKDDLTKLRDNMKQQVHLLSRRSEQLKRKLADSPVMKDLSDQEQKIRVYEQNNFILQDYIAQKTAETDYREIKSNCLNVIADINRTLRQSTNV